MNTFEAEFAKIEEEYRSHPTDKLMEKINNENPPIVVFGYGAVGNVIARNLLKAHGKVVAFCDNFKKGFNEELGVPVISADDLSKSYKDAIIVVAVCYKYNDEIYNQVLKIGFAPENVFRRYSGYELYNLDKLKQYYDGYQWAYNFFDDDISKQIILERIRGYLFYHIMAHSPCEDQYFEKEIMQLSNQEVFVDGGCYTGDTIEEFLKRVNRQYKYIYGFEPDETNYNMAKRNLTEYQNIEIISKGLWNRSERVCFNSASSSSRIDDGVTDSIELTSLDSYFSESQNRPLPTFIKMDIEGSEKNALLGAKKIISGVHPKLAICVYHKPEDIFELPQIIQSLGAYHFTLRHYSPDSVDTVLYAF